MHNCALIHAHGSCHTAVVTDWTQHMAVLVTNLRQARYEVVGIGVLGSLNDLLICGIRLTQADVVTDATAEQNRLLGHDANILTQPVEVEAGDVLTIKFHLHKNNVIIFVILLGHVKRMLRFECCCGTLYGVLTLYAAIERMFNPSLP